MERGDGSTPPRDARPDGAEASGRIRASSPASPVELGRGEVVAGRYEIVRLLGRGGMGEVYEAVDRELGGRVALKTLRAGVARDPRAIERFKLEILLARRITHPNVCRTFDLGHQEGPEGGVTFLTMEMLEGETLGETMRHGGPLPPARALPIALQMAAALSAAHRAGIVHRDFKPGNVILVPPESPGAFPRAVVTDFGLARLADPISGGADPTATATAAPTGTPAYMAPEQVRGEGITPKTDVYALGLVLYEMVTGRQPFEAESAIAVAARRLTDPPTSPRAHVPDLDPTWDRVILRCLERDPDDRFRDADEVASALSGGATAPSPSTSRARRRRRRIVALGGLTAAALATAAILALRIAREPSRPAPSRAVEVKPRTSVAVLGFKNLSGRVEDAWLSTALSEMFTTELAAGEKLRAVPGESVARAKLELGLADADSLARDTLSRVRADLGADVVVLGSFLDLGKAAGGRLRLDVRLQDAVSGEIVAAAIETGTEADLFTLVAEAGLHLREKLGAGAVSAAEVGGVRSSVPVGAEAARLYFEGVAKLRVLDALGARDLLSEAAAADPGHPLIRSALADAWSALGYDARAAEEAKHAFELSSALSREDRLAIEGRYRILSARWEEAVRVFRELFDAFPDSLEHGLDLARAEIGAGHAQGARATLARLRALPPPSGDDPRIDLEEASAAGALSDFRGERDAAARAAEKGKAKEARLLVARARLSEGGALQDLGEPEAALAALKESREICGAAGDLAGVARALNNMAIVLRHRGDLAEARRMLDESLEIARRIGNRLATANALSNLGNVISDQGDLEGSKRPYRESIAIFAEIDAQAMRAGTLANLGCALLMTGRLADAKRAFEESLAGCREQGDKGGVALALGNLADVLVREGDLDGADRALAEAIALDRELGDDTLLASALSGSAEVLEARGDLAAARRKNEEALALRTKLGEEGTAAESRLALATISIEEDRAREAEAAALEVSEAFRRAGQPDGEARAHAARSRALLAEGRLAESRQAADRATAAAARSQDPAVRLEIALAAARVAGASDPAAAVPALERAVSEATRLRHVGLRFEAVLALGEHEIRAGRAREGQERLAHLQEEARVSGFGLVAREAAAARARR